MADDIITKIDQRLRLFYKKNPYVELLQMEVKNAQEGKVILGLNVEKIHTNFYDMAHGGALMSLADTAMGAACLSCNKKVVTLSFSMNFLKAAYLGTHIKAVGTVIHNGSRTMVCETEIFGTDEKLLCKATGNFFVLGKLLEEE